MAFRAEFSLSTGFWIATFLFFFAFLFLLISCGLDIESPTPPTPPEWIQKSGPEEWPERGIDAHESGGIILEWISHENEAIANYILERAIYFNHEDSLGDFELLIELNAIQLEREEFLDLEVSFQTHYLYRIKSIDDAGSQSSYSDTIGYSILPAVNSLDMIPNGTDEALASNRMLSWNNYYTNQAENYCITIAKDIGEVVFRVLLQPTNYFEGEETWRVPDSLELMDGARYRWRVDVLANYINGYEMSGSESLWSSFIYKSYGS